MGSGLTFLIILAVGLVGYFLARSRAVAVVDGDVRRLHSRPVYFGSFAAIVSILPATVVLIAGFAIGASVVENSVRSSLPAELLAKPQNEQYVVYQMVRAIATGLG